LAFGLISSVVAVSQRAENRRLPRMSVGWCSPNPNTLQILQVMMPPWGRMSNHELKHVYRQRLEAVMKILYDHDPDGIGRSIDAPADEYRDLATRLLPQLWAARTASEAGRETRPFQDR